MRRGAEQMMVALTRAVWFAGEIVRFINESWVVFGRE
jgi:hypothetical protein